MELKIGHTATVQFTGVIEDCDANKAIVSNGIEILCQDLIVRRVPKEFVISVDPPPFTANDGDIVRLIPNPNYGFRYPSLVEWYDNAEANDPHDEGKSNYTFELVCKKENREDLNGTPQEPSN